MNEPNGDRVIYYGRNDLSIGFIRKRCLDRLIGAETATITTINDAIEAHQCKLMADNVPELFEEALPFGSNEAARQLFAKACEFIGRALSNSSADALFEQVELQYEEQFWNLVEASGAIAKIQSADFEKLIDRHPGCIGAILKSKKLTNAFDTAVKQLLLQHAKCAAELIIGRLATESGNRKELHLPSSLNSCDIDNIMLDYIYSEQSNPNYLKVLKDWPTRSSGIYNPSPEVRVQAKRAYNNAMGQLGTAWTGLRYNAGVTIDMNQKACKGLEVDGRDLTHVFGGQWLEKHTDPATTMNNLLFVFDFIGTNGLMYAPARKHEESTLLASVGLHVTGEYRTTIGFQMRSGLTYLETLAYSNFLESKGTNLESALEWVYRQYFPEEYGIIGFTLSLPSKDTSWLDKCKAIGPEIERTAKGYAVYSKRGAVDDDFFPFEALKSFSSLKALEEKKYAVAGPEFELFGHALCSNQCMLSYLRKSHESEQCFFDMMIKRHVERHDYPEYLQKSLDELVSKGLIIEENDGRLLPTPRAICIKSVWDNDAIPLRRRVKEDLSVVESLVNDGILCYCDQLFAPVESAYLDYMFNDASFPNSQALRNKYDHAHSAIEDPQATNMCDDYYRLLSILICITLKINEELADKTGRGGVEDFDDWPLYDESILQAAEEL